MVPVAQLVLSDQSVQVDQGCLCFRDYQLNQRVLSLPVLLFLHDYQEIQMVQ